MHDSGAEPNAARLWRCQWPTVAGGFYGMLASMLPGSKFAGFRNHKAMSSALRILS